MGRRFHQTYFVSNPDELLTSLFKRKPNLKKELEERKLKVSDFHSKLQEKQIKLNKVCKLMFETMNLFIDSFQSEFQKLVTTTKTNNNAEEFFSLKTGENLKQIILFNGAQNNSYLTARQDKKRDSENKLKTLINNLKSKNDDNNNQYTEFIDLNFSQLFKYNLGNLSHISRAFLQKEDFKTFDSLFFRINNNEVINKQFIIRADTVSHEMFEIVSKFCNEELSGGNKKTRTNSKVTHVLVAKGRNFQPGSIFKINRDSYKHYWRGLTKAKYIDIIDESNSQLIHQIAKDNVLFLEEC